MLYKSIRQRLRLLILMISLALFPVTIFYVSPVLPIAAAGEGIINASMILLGILLVSSLFFGRFWCGWLCPVGGVQSVCGIIQPKPVGSRWIRFIKYPVFVFWILSILLLLYTAGDMIKINFFYRVEHIVSIAAPWQFIIYYMALAVFAGISLLLGRGAACNMLCMMAAAMALGQTIASKFGLPRLRIFADTGKCSECGLCEKICPNSVDLKKQVKTGEITSAECKKCLACIDACPSAALTLRCKAGRK